MKIFKKTEKKPCHHEALSGTLSGPKTGRKQPPQGTKIMKKALLTFAIITVAAIAAQAQNVIYSFPDNTGAASTVGANITASAFSGGNPATTAAGGQFAITTTSASNNTGASGGFNAGIAAKGGALDPANSSFFSFTLTPAAGFFLDVTGLQFGSRSTGTGPQAFTLRSSLDAFATDVATFTLVNNSTWALLGPSAFSLIGANSQAITFKIIGSGGTGSSSAINSRVDDINVTVAAVASGVPEPTTFAILLGGLGTLVAVQRIRRKM